METNNKPDFEMPDPKGVLYEATKQNGKPGHCYQAQIFKDGKAFIAIEPTEDPWDATKTAFFITKALYHFDALQSENQALKSELKQLENRNYKLEVQGEFIPKDQSLEIQRLKSELDKAKEVLISASEFVPFYHMDIVVEIQHVLKDKR